MAIVWPCSLSVDQYEAAGREVTVPAADCPVCRVVMGSWSGYWRTVREAAHDARIFIARARCRLCEATHALLPAFVAYKRLYSVQEMGGVICDVVEGSGGVRPAARRRAIPHTTARGWVRRFGVRAPDLAASFVALAIDLGSEAIRPIANTASFALAAMKRAFRAACGMPGWINLTLWHFVSAVTTGSFIATNTTSPYLIVGRRYFMAPIPIGT